ncbi:MAG: preprotein translocase subunit YajC [Lachnospiraceae bacterium]|nr:preprotein translocase subunit YajC [Lachnospiraceae bacterium]
MASVWEKKEKKMFRVFADAAAATQETSGLNGMIVPIIYLAIIALVFYFVILRPQKKEQKKMDAMVAALEIGDSVLTTSGFYGVVIDVMDEVVIVEFGSNKNCRIPMKKTAIVEVEKPGSAQETESK